MRTRTFLSAMISAVTTSKSISTTTRITVTSASITPKPLPGRPKSRKVFVFNFPKVRID